MVLFDDWLRQHAPEDAKWLRRYLARHRERCQTCRLGNRCTPRERYERWLAKTEALIPA